MKRMLCGLVPALVLLATAGCDLSNLPSDAKALLTAQVNNPLVVGDPLQTQEQLRLRDGSCAGDGNQSQNQNGGAGNGGNGGNGTGGQGDLDRLRLRDGSCQDV